MKEKCAFALHMPLKIPKYMTYPSPHSKSVSQSWLEILTLPSFLQPGCLVPKVSYDYSYQGHATLSQPCHMHQFQPPCFSPIAMENCLQKRLLERKPKTAEVYSNPWCLYLCSPCHSRAEKMSLEQFPFCQQARGLKRGSITSI